MTDEPAPARDGGVGGDLEGDGGDAQEAGGAPATRATRAPPQLGLRLRHFDPEPIFSAVRVPTLLFYGDDDSWTPIEASIETWRRARSDDVEIVVLPDTGHGLIHPNGAISDAYEQKLIEWTAARPAAPRQPHR